MLPYFNIYYEHDEKVLSLLNELIQEGQYVSGINYRKHENTYIEGKRILLTNHYLKKILEILDGIDVKLSINLEKAIAVNIENQDIDFSFNLIKDKEYIKLISNELNKTQFLTKDYSVLFKEGTIYHISEEQRLSLLPIFKEVKERENQIVFT